MQRTINDAAKTSGRTPESIRRMYNVGGTITEDREPSSDTKQLGMITGSLPSTIEGQPEHWAKTLTQCYNQLGMDTFTFAPTDGNVVDQVRLFAEKVVPIVRQTVKELPPTPAA